MKKNNTFINLFLILFTITSYGQNTFDGSVYLNSNSEWVSDVKDSIIIYTHMFDAINDACHRAEAGAHINIKNSGTGFKRNSIASIEKSNLLKGNIKAITPLSGQTLDFRNYEFSKNSTITIHNGTDCLKNRVKCGVHIYKRHGITIKNLILKGDPRYGIWARNSNDVTISNITMDLNYGSSWVRNGAGIGIRVDNQTNSNHLSGSQKLLRTKNHNLTIDGNIFINGANTHGIETFGIHNIDIGDVLVTNTGGCGVLLNNSTMCDIGIITGYQNSPKQKFNDKLDDNCNVIQDVPEGHYSTFRVANNNGLTKNGVVIDTNRIYCKGVYSRNSGYGFSSVSNSSNCIIDFVDIKNSSNNAILIAAGANNNHIKGGTVSTSGINPTKKNICNDPFENTKLVNIRECDSGKNNKIELTDFNQVVTNTTGTTIIIQELEKGFYDISSGGVIDKDDTRTGFGFSNTANKYGKYIEWNVNGAKGTYTFRWKYANGTSTNRSARVFINGDEVSPRNFGSTGSWNKWHTTSVTVRDVEAGIKNIRLEANQNNGLANIDFIQVTGPGVIPSFIRFNDKVITNSNSAKSINSSAQYNLDTNFIESNDKSLLNATIKFFDLTGKLIKEVTNNLEAKINIEELQQGIYIIQIIKEGTIETSKILKK